MEATHVGEIISEFRVHLVLMRARGIIHEDAFKRKNTDMREAVQRALAEIGMDSSVSVDLVMKCHDGPV